LAFRSESIVVDREYFFNYPLITIHDLTFIIYTTKYAVLFIYGMQLQQNATHSILISVDQRLVGTRVLTVTTVVLSDFTSTTVESVASTSLAALVSIDVTEQNLDVTSAQRGVCRRAFVDGSAVAKNFGRVLAILVSINVPVRSASAFTAHVLVTPSTSMAVITVGHSHSDQECQCNGQKLG
jgi:hypothetical protein